MKDNFIKGDVDAPLRECLTLVAETRPDAVFVLGTCPIEMIDERFEKTVGKRSARVAAFRWSAMHTSGLRLSSQGRNAGLGFRGSGQPSCAYINGSRLEKRLFPGSSMTVTCWIPAVLRKTKNSTKGSCFFLPPSALKREKSLNIIGLPILHEPELIELEQMIDAHGLQINGRYPSDATLEEWRGISVPTLSLVVDRSLYPRLIARLETYQQHVVEVPLPIGVQQSALFIPAHRRGYLERAEAIEPMIEARWEKERACLQEAAERNKGLRIAMGLRTYSTITWPINWLMTAWGMCRPWSKWA